MLGNLKNVANKWLKVFNVKIDSLTAERVECARLGDLDVSGHFNGPIFPTLPQFERCDFKGILETVLSLKHELVRFVAPSQNGSYSFANDYFGSPDSEIAYALAAKLQPRRILEVGSGNSTRLFREAIRAEGLHTELISIDPSPRVDIAAISDRVIASRLEQLPKEFVVDQLSPGDFLFIDSSHEVRVGNDVLRLLLNVMPALAPGVVIHLHDIFLPYEYPREWIVVDKWEQFKEQYVVQALLQDSEAYEVIWPGHFLQRTVAEFPKYFSCQPIGISASLWLRKAS